MPDEEIFVFASIVLYLGINSLHCVDARNPERDTSPSESLLTSLAFVKELHQDPLPPSLFPDSPLPSLVRVSHLAAV